MNRRGAAISSVFSGLLALFSPLARASDPECSQVAVQADTGVRGRWPDLPEAVQRAFHGRDDIDACATVALGLLDSAIAVDVRLPDGRSAARQGLAREDVLPTVEALLLLPQRDEQTAARAPIPESPPPRSASRSAAPSPAAAPRAAAVRVHHSRPLPVAADPGAPDRSPRDSSDRVGLELSLAVGARMGDRQTSAGIAAFSFLDLDGWLAGFEGRIDRYRSDDSGSDAGALELAALGGRRLRFSTLSLDLTVGPALVHQGTATEVHEVSPGGPRTSESSSSTVLRLLCGARLNFATRSTLRTFVGIDGTAGPDRAPGAERPADAPRLPHWTAGVTLGATVGTP
jgi:hypothetical protein